MMDSALPYDLFRDFVPVSQMMSATGALVATPAVSATTVRDFIAQAKGGTSFNLGNYGHGSASHLQSELFNRRAGIELQIVPYSGQLLADPRHAGGPCVLRIPRHGLGRPVFPSRHLARARGLRPAPLAALAGRARPSSNSASRASNRRSGKACFCPQAHPSPPSPPAPVPMAEALRHPDVARTIRELGFEPIGSTPEAFAAMLRQDAPIWRRVVEETGSASAEAARGRCDPAAALTGRAPWIASQPPDRA